MIQKRRPTKDKQIIITNGAHRYPDLYVDNQIEISLIEIKRITKNPDLTLKQAFDWVNVQIDVINKCTLGIINFRHCGWINRVIGFYLPKHVNQYLDSKKLIVNPILESEFDLLENATHGPFIYSVPNTYTDVYGYDIKSNYPYILAFSDFKIPIDPPSSCHTFTSDQVNKWRIGSVSYGLYHCVIDWDYDHHKCVGSKLSRKPVSYIKYESDWYTHYDLEMSKSMGITITMIQNDKPNYYKYDPKKLIKASDLFHRYLNWILGVRRHNKDCILSKMLTSRLHGYLTSRNIKIDKLEDYQNYCDNRIIKTVQLYKKDQLPDQLWVQHIDPDNAYHSNFARMKPFLYAYQKLDVWNRIKSKYNDRIIRFHTDGFLVQGKISEFEAPSDLTGAIVVDDKHQHYDKVDIKNLTDIIADGVVLYGQQHRDDPMELLL